MLRSTGKQSGEKQSEISFVRDVVIVTSVMQLDIPSTLVSWS